MVLSGDIFSIPVLDLGLLLGAFALLLLGAEIFTNSVEWLGHHLGVSESATGSILAAVRTALHSSPRYRSQGQLWTARDAAEKDIPLRTGIHTDRCAAYLMPVVEHTGRPTEAPQASQV